MVNSIRDRPDSDKAYPGGSVTIPQKVLLIDDAPAVAGLVRKHLQAEPLELHTAVSAAAALEMLENEAFDVILLDSALADVDALDFCRRLTSSSGDGDQPVVLLMTAATDTETRRRGLMLGASDFVNKPLDPLELQARVRMAMRLRSLGRLLARRGLMDGVTGLRNGGYFAQRIEQEASLSTRSGHPCSCLLIDLDGLQRLNEQHGRRAGDEILRHVAGVVVEASRSADIVCRCEGDQFGVIAPNTPADALITLAERVRTRIEAMVVPMRGEGMRITVSQAICDARGNADEILDRLQAAVAAAWREGGNRIVRATVEGHILPAAA